MAVPNTTTFTLDVVRLELGLASTTNMSACFTASDASYFNQSYGTKTGLPQNLLAFRDYGSHHANYITVSPTSVSGGRYASIIVSLSADSWWNAYTYSWGAGPTGWFTVTPTTGSAGTTNVTIKMITTAMASYSGSVRFTNNTGQSFTLGVTYSYWA